MPKIIDLTPAKIKAAKRKASLEELKELKSERPETVAALWAIVKKILEALNG